MFGKSIKLFKLFGFQVSIDLTWIILAVLVTWSLAHGVFPMLYEDLETATYWYMGIAGAVGLFISIVWHEFWHSMIARKFGMAMKGITLFIFGGVAEMTEEPPSAKAEFSMAIAGPISSIVIGFIFIVIAWAIPADTEFGAAGAVFGFVGYLNFLLAGFNMVPAFPLDGGRVLRSILWAVKGNLRWATRIAASAGAAFGWFLIIFGVFRLIGGNFVGGIWLALIGMFIKGASNMSYRQLQIKEGLKGEHVRRFMKDQPVTVPPDITIRDFVEDYLYHYHFKMFPVSDGYKLLGCLRSTDIKEIPREEWTQHKVEELLKSCGTENTVHPKTDAADALAQMSNTGNRRLMVVENGELLGVLTMRDMMDFLSVKLDFEGE